MSIVVLTPTQRQLLGLLAVGCTNAEAAHRLDLAEDMVKYHVRQLFTVLGAGNRTEAVSVGYRLGLVPPAEALPATRTGPRPGRGTPSPIPGATYRQVDLWTRKQLLRPENATPGSGLARRWPAEEIRVGTAMARLVAAGLTPEAAHRVARGGQLAPGITVTLTDPTRLDAAS